MSHASTRTDPVLADSIRLCAIPRRLDPTIVGVLRDQPGEPEVNGRLLERLATHPFVLRRDDGSLVYHDDTREAILRSWHADPAQRAVFEGVNARLALHHLEERNAARGLEADLALAATVIQDANPLRYAEIASEIDARVTTPLLQALYHATLMRPTTALDLFSEQAGDYLRDGRPLARSLLGAIKHYIAELPFPTDDDHWRPWLRYHELAVSNAFGGPSEEFEAGLRELLDHADGDARLRVWVLDDLSGMVALDGRLDEAIELGRLSLETAKTSAVNGSTNQAVSYLRLAGMSAAFGHYDSAFEAVDAVLEICRLQDLPAQELSARLKLAEIHKARGDLPQAWQAVQEALKLARTRLPRQAGLNRAVTLKAIDLVGDDEPELADALTAELLGPGSSTTWVREQEIDYASRLLASGRLMQAARMVAELETRPAGGEGDPLASKFALLRVELLSATGRLKEAVALVSELVDGEIGLSVAFFDRMLLLITRAGALASLGDYADAEADLRDLRARCEKGGFELGAGLAIVVLASLTVELGRLDETAELLEDARAGLGDDATGAHATWHTARGKLEQCRGHWDEARASFETALAIYRRTSATVFEELGVLRNLIELSESDGRAAEAAKHAERLAALWSHRAAMDAYRPTDDQRAAASENGLGIAGFCTDTPDMSEAVASAIDHFRAASHRAPEIAWYSLNLAYACRELGRWEDASQAMDHALAAASEVQRTPTLVREVAEHRRLWAHSLVSQSRAAEAARLLRETRDDLGGELEPTDLAALLLDLGDALVSTDDWSTAEPDYRTALAVAEAADLGLLTLRARSRIGLLLALQQSWREAIEELRSSLVAYPPDADGSRAMPWLNDLSYVPYTSVVARGLADALRALEHTALEPDSARDLTAARLLWVAASLRTVLRPLDPAGGSDNNPSPTPWVRAITLEGDDSFFPEYARDGAGLAQPRDGPPGAARSVSVTGRASTCHR